MTNKKFLNEAQKRKTLFKYKIDIVSITLVLAVVWLGLLPLYFDLSGPVLVVIAFLLLFVKPITSFVQHNHVHLPIFNHKALNVIFDLLLSVSTGHIASEWVLHHNIGHHGNPINSLQDTSSVKHPKTREYMTKMQYIISGSLKIFPDCCKMALTFYQQKKKRYLISLIIESLFLFAVHAYFLSYNFTMALLFLLIPNLISRALVWLGAYWHHLEVPANTLYDSTNMYAGPIFNLISLNIGYHVAHHEKPTLHWSKLKERTHQIRALIPEQHILQKIP